LCKAVVSGGNSPKILDAAEHSFDGISIAIQKRREAILPAPVCLGWDIRGRAFRLDLMSNGIAVIAFITKHEPSPGQPVEQGFGGDAVGDLAAGKQERKWPAEAVRQGMDFRGPAATRAANGLREFPPFPPEAQRCALTAEESIRTCAGGPPVAASAWKMSTQMPLAAQRTKRLYSVLRGPYAAGASTQRPPDFNTCTMPLITRRSSTRALPRVSVGRYGDSRANCASVSQNKSLIVMLPPFRSVNHTVSRRCKNFMGPDSNIFND